MAGKEFAFGFVIAASLNNNFNNSFSTASKKITELNDKIKDYKTVLKSSETAAKQGIITTDSYKNALAKLSPEYERLINKQKEYYNQQKKISSLKTARADNASGFFKYSAMAYAFTRPIKAAMSFESVMADVKKVVDFDSPQQFKEMSVDILNLSKKIPMTAAGIGAIIAAAGQANIAKEELVAFAESAAKMGVAFDLTADLSGEMMAKWRIAFKMTQSEVIDLADKINYLGNTSGAKAPLISDVVTRIGPLGEIGGVASGEIAALGASMIGTGVQSEIAATGIKNLILGLVAGEGATKAQANAFAILGLDAVEMSSYMQRDAKGAILTVMRSLQSLDKEKQAFVMQDIFGKESLGAIAPLLSNLEALEKNFQRVGDKALYGGSMEAEFQARAATAENATQLFKNQLDAAQISLTIGLLPALTNLINKFSSGIDAISRFTSEYPNLSTGIFGTVIATTILAATLHGIMWVVNGVKIAFAGYEQALLLYDKRAKAVSATTKVITMLTRGWAIAQGFFSAVLAATPVGWLIIGVSALILAGTLLYRNWDKVREFFETIWDSPIAKVAFFAAGPIGWLIGAGVALIANWDTVKEWFITLWDNPSLAIEQFIDGLKAKMTGAVDWLREKWESIDKFLSTPIFGRVNISAQGSEIAHNAYGGIYGPGAFITSFAERSGESAIPHTPNRRNIGLLAQTNEIMGNPLGGGIYAPFSPTITVQGNGDESKISEILTQKMREFEDMIGRLQNQQRRVGYSG